MAEAMTKEEAMTVAVQGERAELGKLIPALKILFATVRELEIQCAQRYEANVVLRQKLNEEKESNETNPLRIEMPSREMAVAVHLIVEEALDAYKVHGPLLNPHHFEGVFREEYDELWDEIKVKETLRDPDKMRNEAKQAAAVILRFMLDCCHGPANLPVSTLQCVEEAAVLRTGPVG